MNTSQSQTQTELERREQQQEQAQEIIDPEQAAQGNTESTEGLSLTQTQSRTVQEETAATSRRRRDNGELAVASVALSNTSDSSIAQAKQVRTRYEKPLVKALFILIFIQSLVAFTLVWVRKLDIAINLSPLGTEYVLNASLAQGDSFDSSDGEEDVQFDLDSFEVEDSGITASVIINFLFGLGVGLVTPSTGIATAYKKSEYLLNFFYYFSLVAGVYTIFITLSNFYGTDFYEDADSAFTNCLPGEQCFDRYLTMEILFGCVLLVGAGLGKVLKNVFDGIDEDTNGMEDAEIFEEAPLAQLQESDRNLSSTGSASVSNPSPAPNSAESRSREQNRVEVSI